MRRVSFGVKHWHLLQTLCMHVPMWIIKNQCMFQNGVLVSGLSVTPSLILNYFMNVLICPIFTNCSRPWSQCVLLAQIHVVWDLIQICYVSFNRPMCLFYITGASSDETCQFRDLALTIVADTVYARPYTYYKKPMYVPKWSISFGTICHTLFDFKLFHECADLSNIY